MPQQLRLIADSDMLIGLLSKEDIHHKKVLQLLVSLHKNNATIYFPSTVIAETITTMQIKLKNPELAAITLERVKEKKLPILSVDDDVIEIAASFFHPRGSKKNTFFDAIVVACAKIYKADAIFSFDEWYKKIGFKLASNL